MDKRFNVVKVVNRSVLPLEGCFDGMVYVFPPSYAYVLNDKGEVRTTTVIDDAGQKRVHPVAAPIIEHGEIRFTHVPAIAAERCKWQCRQMGTEDPTNPTDAEYLLGVAAWGDEISFLPPTDAIEAIDRSMLDDQARSARPMATAVGRRASKKRRRAGYTDPKLKNVVFAVPTEYAD